MTTESKPMPLFTKFETERCLLRDRILTQVKQLCTQVCPLEDDEIELDMTSSRPSCYDVDEYADMTYLYRKDSVFWVHMMDCSRTATSTQHS